MKIIILSILIFVISVNAYSSDAASETDSEIIASAKAFTIYQGQNEECALIGLHIELDDNSLIHESLCWHYRMGFRHFSLAYRNLTQHSHQCIKLFRERVKGTCSFVGYEYPMKKDADSGISVPAESILEGEIDIHPILSETISHFLKINGRQFLCLNSPIHALLDIVRERRVYFPIFSYCGLDVTKSEEEHIDILLPYRTTKTKKFVEFSPNTVQSLVQAIPVFIHTDVFIADYCKREEALPSVNGLIYQPLPMKQVVISSINHAYHHIDYESRYSLVNLSESTRSFEEKYYAYTSSESIGCGYIAFGSSYLYGIVLKSASSTIFKFLNYLETQRNDIAQVHRDFLCKDQSFLYEMYQKVQDENVFKFTVVRNPFARILSAYLHNIVYNERNRSSYLNALGLDIRKRVSFLDFLERINEMSLRDLSPHFSPMWALTLSEIIPYDFIGKLENFTTDFEIIICRLNVQKPIEKFYHTTNATNAKNQLLKYYESNHSRASEIVRKKYAKDFSLYDYDTNLPI